jgi:hypothetical protein
MSTLTQTSHKNCLTFGGISSTRTVQNWRNIASRTDIHPYFGLGEVRVLKLISLTKNDEGEDRIRPFFDKHEVDYNPGESITLALKTKIDKVLREASKKTREPVSVTKLTDVLKKNAEEFKRITEDDIGELAADKKTELAEILRELLEKLGS